MQGQRSSITTLPENLTFDHGSTSTDVAIDTPIPWNAIPASTTQNILPDYRMPPSSSSGSHIQYVQLGESSSRAPRQYEPSGILSSSDINSNINATTNEQSYLVHNPIPTLPQDLNMIGDQEEDDCRVVEGPTSLSYISIGSSSSNEQRRSDGGSSSDSYGGYPMDVTEDGRRLSCKRKAHAGPSSGVGPSNCFQNNERRQWFHNIPPPQITENNNLIINNSPEQMNSRLRLGVGGAIPTSPFSLTPSGNPETSRRNFRLRINGLYEQEPVIPENNPFPSEADIGNLNRPSSRNSSRLVLHNRLVDFNPNPNPTPTSARPVENGNLLHGPPTFHVPSLRRSQHHSRWGSGSHTRTVPTASASAIPEEPISRNVPRSISEHPMFIPGSHIGNSNLSQNHANWNLAGGANNIPGNVASTSRVGSSGGSHRGCPQYPRRLSEIVRRSLASSSGVEHGGQSSNFALRSGSSSGYQEMPVPGGPDSHGLRTPNSRSALLERHLEGAFGIPYSLRTLAAAGEGRSSIMSEQIRHVLDLMRRGEGLRFEDVMILDHSVLFGMADIHDRHRDMRLDVDNMSYEELLALEERIGNVCTGLNEETILSHLKRTKYANNKAEELTETEPCSICREEYNDGEDLGTLECGHDFHRDCIKQWLMQKNLCPICKTTGLTT